MDKLDRFPVQWGEFPRIKVWNLNQISLATKEDRIACGGDYGVLGVSNTINFVALSVANHMNECLSVD